MPLRRRVEDEIQRAVVQHLWARGAYGIVFWHHPAGGYRRPVEAAILKGLGARSGFPDLFILYRARLFGLELKSGKGRLSPAQAATHVELTNAGAIVGVAYGLDEALAWLEAHELLRGTAQWPLKTKS